jgi:hypothetical protein
MSRRNRSWLDGIVRLGVRADAEGISPRAIALQQDSVLTALERLEVEPGVLLADEVGMGKTYQALALMAVVTQQARSAGAHPHILVVTPRPVLNAQWLAAAQRFDEHGFFGFQACLGRIPAFAAVRNLRELPDACETHGIVFAPVTVFSSARGQCERGFLLETWMRSRGMHGRRRQAIRARIAESGVKFRQADTFLGRGFDDFRRVPQAAWRRRHRHDGDAGLEDLWHRNGLEAFRSAWAVKRAFNRARFHFVRSLLPDTFDLLVVDEAHKLKNPYTVQSQAVTQVLGGLYDKAAFLTATPFQLSVSEMARVFELFGHARDVRDGFQTDVDALFSGIDAYQKLYDAFEDGWRFATETHAQGFADWYAQVRDHDTVEPDAPDLGSLDDPNVAELARMAWKLRHLKDHVVQPGFRRWTIRSLKPGKKDRRREHVVTLTPDDRTVCLVPPRSTGGVS